MTRLSVLAFAAAAVVMTTPAAAQFDSQAPTNSLSSISRIIGEPPTPVERRGFSFPVVPRGQARIRVQMSAAHQPAHLDRAVAAFEKVGRELGILPGGAGR